MKEIRRCLILLHPVKHSMFTCAIFIRPDSELIWESVCVCAKLFVDEENVLKSNRGRTQTLTDSKRKRHKKEDLASFVYKLKKDVIPTYSIFQHVYGTFFRPNRILTVEWHRSLLYIFFFSGENAR